MAGQEIEKRSIASITDDVQKLPDKQLFASTVDEFMDVVWEEREARLQEWAEEGRSQRWIAERVDRDQAQISRWQKRFEIKSTALRAGNQTGRKATDAVRISDDFNDDEEDEVIEAFEHRQPPARKQKPDSAVQQYRKQPRSPQFIVMLGGWIDQLNTRLWPLMRDNYLEDTSNLDIEDVDEAIDKLEKMLENLKHARGRI